MISLKEDIIEITSETKEVMGDIYIKLGLNEETLRLSQVVDKLLNVLNNIETEKYQ